MSKGILVLILFFVAVVELVQPASARTAQRSALAEIEIGLLRTEQADSYSQRPKHTVYPIVNATQQMELVPELRLSNGELVQALLESGRDDIEVVRLDTCLTRG